MFAMLDDLQKRLRAPVFHQVLIQPICNAAVVQAPRLGVLGWQRNYLLLGLPLMDGLAPEEMRAVLAHEFAHLSREHGRLTHWLYRLRRSWEVIFKQLSAPRARMEFSTRPMVVNFVKWFWPRFNAHAFVLSRANEYEADATSARVAGRPSAASALIRLCVISRQIELSLWPALLRLANEQPEPPDDAFERLRDGLRAGPSAEETAKWLEEGLQMASTNSDTHPCLSERLRALDASRPAPAPTPPQHSAAEALLGSSLETVRAAVQHRWKREFADKWRERHGRALALKRRLSTLGAASAGTKVDVDRLWDNAIAQLDLQGGKVAKPLLEQIVALRSDHVGARIQLGRLLLEENVAEGVEHLERAMELDEQCVSQACNFLHNYYRRSGQADRLRELDARMDRYEKAFARSQAERREVNAGDTFVPHGLTEAELQRLRETLAAESGIVHAHLARKELQYFPNQRLFVLCVYPRRAWHGIADREADRALVQRLSQKLQLPGRMMVFSPTGNFRPLARRVSQVAGAEIL